MGLTLPNVRHIFFVPCVFWPEATLYRPLRSEFNFSIRPGTAVFLTEEELSFYKQKGWDAFEEMVINSGLDVTDAYR